MTFYTNLSFELFILRFKTENENQNITKVITDFDHLYIYIYLNQAKQSLEFQVLKPFLVLNALLFIEESVYT